MWFTPLVLSMAFHIVMPALLVMGQFFFKPSRSLPEVYTVSLLNVEEASRALPPPPPPLAEKAGPAEPVQQAEQLEPEQPKPVQPETKLPEPVQPEPTPPEPDQAAEAISLKPKEIEPIKEKKKKIDPDLQVKKKLESLRKKMEAKLQADKAQQQKERRARQEADRLEKDAREKADLAKEAAGKAVAALRSSLKRGAATTKGGMQGGVVGGVAGGQKGGKVGGEPGATVGGGGDANKGYYAAVAVRIQENWILPDLQSWQENLLARVVLKVQRDGKVIDMVFEEKSANAYFDQFVMKAVRDASPLPPFPEEMNEAELEIGLVFRPRGLF